MTDAERQGDGWDAYTDCYEQVVAMMLSGDNFWRNFGLEHGGFDELVEASRGDAHNWRRQAQMILSALVGERWRPPRREAGKDRALWMKTDQDPWPNPETPPPSNL